MQGITDRPFANTNTAQKGFCIARLHRITSSHAHTRSARGYRRFFRSCRKSAVIPKTDNARPRGGGGGGAILNITVRVHVDCSASLNVLNSREKPEDDSEYMNEICIETFQNRYSTCTVHVST